MFIKATIFSLLTFSTAILAEPKCSDTFDVLVSDVEDCIKHLQEENGDGTTQCTGITDGIELYQSGSAHIMGYTDGVDETYSWWYVPGYYHHWCATTNWCLANMLQIVPRKSLTHALMRTVTLAVGYHSLELLCVVMDCIS